MEQWVQVSYKHLKSTWKTQLPCWYSEEEPVENIRSRSWRDFYFFRDAKACVLTSRLFYFRVKKFGIRINDNRLYIRYFYFEFNHLIIDINGLF